MSPQHHWFSDNTDEARQWSEEISIKTDITTNFIIFPSKCTVKHPIVLCCAANTTIKTTISLKITLDESDWIFQTRREKILEARNKEIRLKEKTKVTTKLFPIKILQWGLCPRIFFTSVSFFQGMLTQFFFSSNAYSNFVLISNSHIRIKFTLKLH